MFFTDTLYFFTIMLFLFSLAISIYLNKKKRYEEISIVVYYIVMLCFFLCIFSLMELSVMVENEATQIIVYELEMFLILCLFTYFYFIFYRKTSEEALFYTYLAVVILFSHIIISSIFLAFVSGTIITGLILILAVIYIKNFNEYLKRVYLIFGLGCYIYISSNIFHNLLFALIALLIVNLVISMGYRPINGRILNVYHTGRTIINSIFFNPNKITQNKVKRRPLFWICRIKVTQIGREDKLEKKKIHTWLQDFFKKKKVYRVKIVLSGDIFEISFLIKTKTLTECKRKGSQILTHLRSIFKGLDAELDFKKITPKYLYKKEKWWLLKFPKAPYTQQIDLLNRLITLFGEDRNKTKLLIMWKKALPKKILETRAKIIAMKYKDPQEKNVYLNMWREELFCVKIYINYQVIENDPIVKEQELLNMKGRIESLEIPARNVKKKAKIRRILCGARADFYRGNLFNVRYFTPISFDFTLSDKMPLYVPIGLKNQIIKRHIYKNDPDAFSVGKWIDETGLIRETFNYVSVDHFNQGAFIGGLMNKGKTRLIGHIIKSIKEKRPEVGILIINFKREYGENIYSAQKFYKPGINFNLPYFTFTKEKNINRAIEGFSKAVMGALGFEQEGVKACKITLQNYIEKLDGPPESIIRFLNTIRDFFTLEDHNYDEKFRSRIMSALNTRIKSDLNNDDIIKALNPKVKIGQWYKDWKNGKTVQIELYDCNEWEQRLIAILILQTIYLLSPEKEAKGLKYLIVIDEAHRMVKKMDSAGKHKSDDYIACEQIEKIFSIIFSEFRDRGISFLFADQRADHLHKSATKLPAMKFLMGLDAESVEVYSKNPHHIEAITHLPNRHCVLDNGATGEFYLFETMDYSPKKVGIKYERQDAETGHTLDKNLNHSDPILENKIKIEKNVEEKKVSTNFNPPPILVKNIICPKCQNIIGINNKFCPNCNLPLNFC